MFIAIDDLRAELGCYGSDASMRIAKQTIDTCQALDVHVMLFPFFGPSNFQTSDEAFELRRPNISKKSHKKMAGLLWT